MASAGAALNWKDPDLQWINNRHLIHAQQAGDVVVIEQTMDATWLPANLNGVVAS
jgi:hypothetical protein